MFDYVLRTGAPGVLGAFISLFVFGANVVLVLGTTAGRILAIGAVVLATAAMLLITLARTIESNRQNRRSEDRLQLYCQSITDRSTEPLWRVVSWEDRVQIAKNGDTAEEITVKIVVTSPEFRFVRITNGCGWPQSERLRRLVSVETSSIAISEGDGGASWFVTKSWKKNGKLEVLAHCRTDIAVNSVVTLRLYYSWPAKCEPLMRGECEPFKLSFRGGLENLDYTVTVLSRRMIECEAIDGPGSTQGDISIESDYSKDTQRVRLEARDIGPGVAIGMNLKLKGAISTRRLLPFWRRW